MTDSMIERVARAIYYSQRAATAREKDQWGKAGEMQRAGYLADARAAIQAMRTPTEAMVKAGAEPVLKLTQAAGARTTGLCFSAAAIVYQTVVDAALKEKP